MAIRSGRDLVAGFGDRDANRLVVEPAARHRQTAGFELDVDRGHTGDLGDLFAHGEHAMAARHAIDGVRALVESHSVEPFTYGGGVSDRRKRIIPPRGTLKL